MPSFVLSIVQQCQRQIVRMVAQCSSLAEGKSLPSLNIHKTYRVFQAWIISISIYPLDISILILIKLFVNIWFHLFIINILIFYHQNIARPCWHLKLNNDDQGCSLWWLAMIAPFVWLFADEIDLLRMLDLAPMHMTRRRMIHKGKVMIRVLSRCYFSFFGWWHWRQIWFGSFSWWPLHGWTGFSGRQIHFIFWTNTFHKLDKCIS